jgi:hypothetical protein
MKQRAIASVLTTDGQMIEIHDKINADALYHDCMVKSKQTLFIQIQSEQNVRFIPTNRIREVIFYGANVQLVRQ